MLKSVEYFFNIDLSFSLSPVRIIDRSLFSKAESDPFTTSSIPHSHVMASTAIIFILRIYVVLKVYI